MQTALNPQPSSPRTRINLVKFSAGIWLGVASLGQWAFAAYIALFYVHPMLAGDLLAWNTQILLVQPPVIEGDPLDTLAFGLHAIGAGVIFVTGALQLIPILRRRWPTFHRWNGRVFLVLVVLLSLSGFYLTWVRGPVPSQLSEWATSANGVLILLFALLAVRAALLKRFAAHERWAARLFLVANAQWFLRIGGFGYFAVSQGLGRTVSFEDLFFQAWVWGCFLVPLAVAEFYFWARAKPQSAPRWGAAVVLILSAVFTALGSFVFTVFNLQLISGNLPL